MWKMRVDGRDWSSVVTWKLLEGETELSRERTRMVLSGSMEAIGDG